MCKLIKYVLILTICFSLKDSLAKSLYPAQVSKVFGDIKTGMILSLEVTDAGLWIGSENGVVGVIGSEVIHFSKASSHFSSNYISDIQHVGGDNLLIVAFGDGLYRLDMKSHRLQKVNTLPQSLHVNAWTLMRYGNDVAVNAGSDIVVLDGLSFEPKFSLSEAVDAVSRNIIDFGVDDAGVIWWVEQHKGVFSFDPTDRVVVSYPQKSYFESAHLFVSIHVSKQSIIVGSDKGVHIFDKNNEVFYLIDQRANPAGIEQPVVEISEDFDGNIWVAAERVYRLDAENKVLTNPEQLYPVFNADFLSSVWKIDFDKFNNVYAADTQHGLLSLPKRSSAIQILNHRGDLETSFINDVTVAGKDEILFSLENSVLVNQNKSSHSFKIMLPEKARYWFAKANQHMIQIVAEDGLSYIFDRQTRKLSFPTYLFRDLPKNSRLKDIVQASNGIFLLIESENGKQLYWHDGLNFELVPFTKNATKIVRYDDNTIYAGVAGAGIYSIAEQNGQFKIRQQHSNFFWSDNCILPLSANNTWMCSSKNGGYINLGSDRQQHFDQLEGLVVRGAGQISANEVLLASNQGLFYFRQSDGLLLPIDSSFGIRDVDFEYDAITTSSNIIVARGDNFTYLIDKQGLVESIEQFLGQQVSPSVVRVDAFDRNTRNALNLTSHIDWEDKQGLLNVAYHTNTLAVTATVAHLLDENNLPVQYRLDAEQAQWRTLSNSDNTLLLDVLAPGEHSLQLRVQHPLERAQPVTELKIIVAAPWWRSTGAYLSYACLLLMVGLLIRYRINITKIRHQQAVAQREQEQRDLDKANKAYLRAKIGRKQQLFLRISHEVQTPLSLILGPLQQVRQAPDDEQNSKRIEVINRNARRLHLLVNQLLEVERLDAVKAQPMQSYALTQQLPMILANLEAILLARQQALVSKVKVTGHIRLTSNALETILHSLLCFAAERTPANGTVQLHAKCDELHLQLRIITSGEPLGEQEANQLFDQFTARADTALQEDWQNSLALVQEVVLANDGWLGVDPSSENGMCLRISLPMVPAAKPAVSTPALVMEEVRPVPVVDPDRPVIIIADNNADMRRYLLEALKTSYTCLEAGDGRQVLQIVRSVTPALIVCQAQLSHTDGISLATTINNSSEHAHIPFVLTCYSPDADFQEQCSGAGVDAVLSQPVQVTDLQSCVARLLTLHQRYRTQAANPIAPKSPFAVPQFSCSREQAFYTRVLAVLEQHYKNEGFCRADAAQALAISERQMARKLVSLFNQPFNELLKRYRLHQAKSLLEEGMQITQVAFAVGFGTSSYFSSSFKAEYAQTPSQYQEGAARLAAS